MDIRLRVERANRLVSRPSLPRLSRTGEVAADNRDLQHSWRSCTSDGVRLVCIASLLPAGDPVQQTGVASRENSALILRDAFRVGAEFLQQRVAAVDGIEQELANAFDVVDAGPPSGTHLLEQSARLAFGMNRAENRLAAADIFVELVADVKRICVEQQNVVGLVHCGQGFALRQIAVELDHVAESQERLLEIAAPRCAR